MLSDVISIPFIALHSTHTAIQLPRKFHIPSFNLSNANFSKMVPNIQIESSSKPRPVLTVDEVEKVQRQRVANLIGHVQKSESL